MAKKNDAYKGYVLHDDEPNPFLMSEDEYTKASEEYDKKVKSEIEKMEKWKEKEKEKNG
jgi:hypothetical protein